MGLQPESADRSHIEYTWYKLKHAVLMMGDPLQNMNEVPWAEIHAESLKRLAVSMPLYQTATIYNWEYGISDIESVICVTI